MVTFPDIPEAISYGKTEAEAIDMAHDCLLTALEFYFDDKRPVPAPSTDPASKYTVTLPENITARILADKPQADLT